ncbi:hypothetical protein HaLaN_21046 [Haematococcus lacustris]|uniref:Uncharacterized protein n=1 Tax=Haematococcus lacustris TaxID=44745 RepID=A0A699ZNA0_HAELA|nr:hypothetical protein HaLaN_21046 [Haematococcus lacustris]
MACTHEAVAIVLSRAHTTKGGENVKPLLLILAVSAAAIDPPVWPDAYEDMWTLYNRRGSSAYPVHVWYDNPGKQMRVTFYNGLDETYVMPVSMAGIAREHPLHCPPCMSEYHWSYLMSSVALALGLDSDFSCCALVTALPTLCSLQ